MWPNWYRNYYRCTECGCEWTDICPERCPGDCPCCGERNMPPHKSDDLRESEHE